MSTDLVVKARAAPLLENFDKFDLHPLLVWSHPPAEAHSGLGKLVLHTHQNTDFWQRTHYGFRMHNGALLGAECEGDFVLHTHVAFRPVHQYDQAGLMVEISPSCWLKTSVEYEPDGPWRLGAVVTNSGYSDWSTTDFPAGVNEVELRITRSGSDYTVESKLPGQSWSQMRLAHLIEDGGKPVRAGLYACSPKGAGYKAEFSFLHFLSPAA